jgi:hypothetical protein
MGGRSAVAGKGDRGGVFHQKGAPSSLMQVPRWATAASRAAAIGGWVQEERRWGMIVVKLISSKVDPHAGHVCVCL